MIETGQGLITLILCDEGGHLTPTLPHFCWYTTITLIWTTHKLYSKIPAQNTDGDTSADNLSARVHSGEHLYPGRGSKTGCKTREQIQNFNDIVNTTEQRTLTRTETHKHKHNPTRHLALFILEKSTHSVFLQPQMIQDGPPLLPRPFDSN